MPPEGTAPRDRGHDSLLQRALKPQLLLPVIVGLGLLAYVAYVASARESMTQLWNILRETWLLVLGLMVPYLICRAIVWYRLLRRLGIRVQWRHVVMAFCVGEMTKSLPGGIYLENLVLRRMEHLDRVEATRSTVATTATLGLESALAAPLIVILGVPGTRWIRWTVVGVAAAWVVVLLIVHLIAVESSERVETPALAWLRNAATTVKEFLSAGLELLRRGTAVLLLPTAVYMMIYVAYLYGMDLAAGDHHLTLLDAVVVYAVIVLAVVMIPIPTEIGLAEISGLGALEAYGVHGSTAAIVVLGLRLLATGATMLEAGIALLVLHLSDREHTDAQRRDEREAPASA
jgi:uncharacterized membrane protein YbhN (UPF0104 family)